jgi:hypothetical protein
LVLAAQKKHFEYVAMECGASTSVVALLLWRGAKLPTVQETLSRVDSSRGGVLQSNDERKKLADEVAGATRNIIEAALNETSQASCGLHDESTLTLAVVLREYCECAQLKKALETSTLGA